MPPDPCTHGPRWFGKFYAGPGLSDNVIMALYMHLRIEKVQLVSLQRRALRTKSPNYVRKIKYNSEFIGFFVAPIETKLRKGNRTAID